MASKAANAAPIIGPSTGIHEYPQSLDALSLIGKTACINLGPKSLAGFIA